jgi:hypothetical protein
MLYQSKNCEHIIPLFFMMYNVYWYCQNILQSWKLRRPHIQLRPHHFWTYTSNLTTVGNSVLKFMINFNLEIIIFPNMCSNIPALLYENQSFIIVSVETEYISTRSSYRNINFLRERMKR